MTLHPDGVRVAAQITDTRTATNDLYFVDVLTREVSPLTTARAYAGRPVFSPDGRRMAYTLQPPGSLDDFHIKDLRTGADALILGSKSLVEQPAAWSRDGRVLLVYRTTEPNGPFGLDTWWAESGKREKFVESTTIQAAFSPDGRFVAYGSTESGTAQVVITTFPEPKRSWPLTTDGGRPFSWSDDGKEILVASLSGHIVAYPVTVSEENVTIGKPSILIKDVGNMVAYSSANRDHSRIAIRVDADAAADRGEIQLLFGALRR
jgi:serine/threonine-protein kinase